MPIITKPSTIDKNSPAEISLDKAALAAVSLVVADDYFSDSDNWKEVFIYYKSSTGNQREILKFNATVSSPTADFLVSDKALDIFEVQKIVIVDFDAGNITIPRSQLTTSEFDIDMSTVTPPAYDYINWDLTNGPTTNAVGAVLTNPSSQNWFYMMKSSAAYASAFEVSYTFDGADCLEIGVGMADSPTLGTFGGSVVMINRSGLYFEINTNGDTWLPGQYSFNAVGTNTIKFSRTGGTVTIYLNGVSVHSYSNSALLYPLGRPYLGNITSAYYNTPTTAIAWESKATYTSEPDGGVTSTNTSYPTSDSILYALAPIDTSTNFEIIYNIYSNAWVNYVFLGYSNQAKSSWSGIYLDPSFSSVLLNNNPIVTGISLPTGGVSATIKFQKIGGSIYVKINETTVATYNTLSLVDSFIYPAIRLMEGNVNIVNSSIS